MIESPHPQGSREWQIARLSIPTASNFSRLITPKTRKPSAQATGYLHEILASTFLGRPLEEFSSEWTERGGDLEAEAIRAFEFEHGLEVRRVGLCTTDDGLVGASPDGLIGDDAGLEVKNLALDNHVAAALGDPVADYFAQLQGCLLVTGRRHWWLLIHNPSFPPILHRVERDEPFLSALRECLDDFLAKLAAGKQRLLDLGWVPVDPFAAQKAEAADLERKRAAFDAYMARSAEPVETRQGPDLSDPASFPF